MSTEIEGTSRVLCPICDAPPADGARPGASCASCGSMLVRHVERTDDLIGTIIDERFEVLALLGQGGMGRVYRAVQRSIGREVALKVMDRRFEEDLAAVKRFFREAKLASQLAHPNTVGVIEFAQSQSGLLYLALELVRGQTLETIVEAGGAQPPIRIARIGVQLCDALEAAHALGIIHRDLKLENVMVLDGGRDHVKVLDFGLALALGDQSRATATGVIAGTPRYLAPEVVGGAPPAPTQDLYALGVILGELATGKVLWEVTNFVQLFGQKLEPPPTLAAIEPRLRALVAALIDLDPDKRPTVGAARAALQAIEEGVWLEIETDAPDGERDGRAQPPSLMTESRLVPIDRRTGGHDAHGAHDAHGPHVAKEPTRLVAPPPTAPVRPTPLPPLASPAALAATGAVPTIPAPRSQPPGAFAATAPMPILDDAPASRAEPAEAAESIADAHAAPLHALDLEPGYMRGRAAERDDREPARARQLPAAPKPGAGGVIAAIVIVGGIAAGAFVWMQRHHHEPAPPIRAGDGVSIRIVGPGADTAITIDGHAAGVAPITLTRTASEHPFVIGAIVDGRRVDVTVIPDRDQTIDVARPGR